MKFLLKRRLNPFLLLTTVVGLSLLVGLSIVYQTQFDEVASERADLEEEIEKLNNEIEGLEENNTRLLTRNNELHNQTKSLEQEIVDIQTEEDDLESEIESLQNQTDQLTEERNEYRDDLESAELDIRDLCQIEDITDSISETICNDWVEDYEN